MSGSFHAFVSYSSRDQCAVAMLCEELGAQGLSLWRDEEGIRAGTLWRARIEDGLRRSLSVLFVVNRNWLESAECARELELALEQGKKLLPLLAGVEPGSLPAGLQRYQGIRIPESLQLDAELMRAVREGLTNDEEIERDLLRINGLAIAWDARGRAADYGHFLAGAELKRAEEMLARLAAEEQLTPRPGVLEQAFLAASREAGELRSREFVDMVSRILVDLRDDLRKIGKLSLLEKVDGLVADHFGKLGRPEDLSPEEQFAWMRALLRRGETHLSKSSISRMDRGGAAGREDRLPAEKFFLEARAIGEELCAAASGEGEREGRYRNELIAAKRLLGDVARASHRFGEAILLCQGAVEMGERLCVECPEEAEFLAGLAKAHNTLGVVYNDLEQWGQARRQHERAIACRRRVLGKGKGESGEKELLALDHANLAATWQSMGGLEAAKREGERALEIVSQLLRAEPGNMHAREQHAWGSFRLGSVFLDQGQPDQGLRMLDQALGIFRELVRWDPENSEWFAGFADIADFVAGKLSERKDYHRSLRLYRENQNLLEELLPGHLGDPVWKRRVTDLQLRFGEALQNVERYAEARQAYELAWGAAEAHLKRGPGEVSWLYYRYASRIWLANVSLLSGDLEKAAQESAAGRAAAEELAEQDLANPEWKLELANSHHWTGMVASRKGEAAVAVRAYESAVEVMRALLRSEPAHRRWRRLLSGYLVEVGKHAAAVGEGVRAEACFRESVEVIDSLRDSGTADEADGSWRLELAHAEFRAGMGRYEGGVGRPGARGLEEAVEAFDRARAAYDAQPPSLARSFFLAESWRARADCLNQLAQAGMSGWSFARAAADYEESRRRLEEDLLAQDGDHPGYREALVRTLFRLGNTRLAEGRREGALACFQRAFEENLVLVSRFPGVPAFARFLPETAQRLSQLMTDQAATARVLEDAHERLSRLVRNDPSDEGLRDATALTAARLGLAYQGSGELGRARALLEEAEPVLRERAARPGAEVQWSMDYAVLLSYLGHVQEEAERRVEVYERALAIWRQQLGSWAETASWKQNVAVLLHSLAQVRQGEDPSGATALFQESVELFEQAAGTGQDFFNLSMACVNYGASLTGSGEEVSRILVQRRAVQAMEESLRREPERADWKNQAAVLWLDLGRLQASESPVEAEGACERAIVLLEVITGGGKGHPVWRENLAVARQQLEEIRG